MRKIIYLIFIAHICLFTSCDVHEFPEVGRERIPFLLHLDFNTEMTLHKEIYYTRNGEMVSQNSSKDYDIRYIISAYRTENLRQENRVADTTFVFTKSDISNLNYTARLTLTEGTYTFRVWADYVDAGTMSDKYYDTRDFAEIILADRSNHVGSNDFRDAFRGYATATVASPVHYTGDAINNICNEATAEMRRPMGKFKFVSTDVDVFVSRVVEMMKDKGLISDADANNKDILDQILKNIDLNDFTVIFRYNIFMPCSFNMFTDKPADSWTGMTFKSRMYIDENNEMAMGYDYIFVNGAETTLSVSLEVYNKDGELMSSTNPVNVPIVRSKLTVVKGAFLEAKASGGVTINPGFDGDDYNIEIK